MGDDDGEGDDLDAAAGAGAAAAAPPAAAALAGAKRAIGAISRHGAVVSSFMGRPAGAGALTVASRGAIGAPKPSFAAPPRAGAGAGAGSAAAAAVAAAAAAAKKPRIAGQGGR